MFTSDELETLQAIFDTVIPPDQQPGGWSGGVKALLDEHGSDFMSWSIAPLRDAATHLNADALTHHRLRFPELTIDEATSVLRTLVANEPAIFDVLFRVAVEGYYGGTQEPAGWAVSGFLPVLPPEHLDPEPLAGVKAADLADYYDVVVVGAGAGGGVAAAELAIAGLRVLLVERARPHRDSELRGNHLQGKRADVYMPQAGAGIGSPRVVEAPDGGLRTVPSEGSGSAWALNAITLGGGTRLWQGMSWRFLPEDFVMASTYGVPESSTLVDWPFTYDELAPYYERVEWELGVSGDAASAVGRSVPRARGYPMPALPDDPSRRAFAAAAGRLGWHTSPIPFAINSVPRDGRAACVRCPHCVGQSCPVNAKNGTHNTFIPRALASGNCDLLTSTMVVRIAHGGGTASAVHLITEPAAGTGDLPVEGTVRAGRVVLSAGAVETARLLILSDLGNDWVGRNHHTHGIAIAVAGKGPDTNPYLGPGHSVATLDFLHRGEAPWGGGVLFDLHPALPLDKARFGRALAAEPFGHAHKSWMRDHPNLVGAMAMVQEVPHELSDVRVSAGVRDRLGVPTALLRGRVHPATRQATDFMLGRAREWVGEVGGSRIFDTTTPGGVPGAEHSAGTARMGHDPRMSACDSVGRLHGPQTSMSPMPRCIPPTEE